MAEILTPEALAFVEKLCRQFDPTRQKLLAKRVERQKEIDHGALPDFPAATKSIRDDKSWRVASIPADLQDRRTEITGPVDRKMVINALNSGAKVFMADFEDLQWLISRKGTANFRPVREVHREIQRAFQPNHVGHKNI